jgi:hypothetical protein
MKHKLCWVLTLLVTAGCVQPFQRVPSTVAEYEAIQKTDPQKYSQQVLLLHNVSRVLDPDLRTADRVASLELAVKLGGDDAKVRADLAGVLTDPRTPPEVHQAVLTFLLKKDHPDLAGFVVAAMGNLTKYSALHQSILDWLTKHPTPEVLSELVKLWAGEDASGPNEARYREVVTKITGKPWDEALLQGLNTPGFSAPSAALAVLAKRMPDAELRKRLATLTPQTEAVTAIQVFLGKFDYLPGTAAEVEAIVQFYKQNRSTIEDTARLVNLWRGDYGYAFNPRDLHLLSRLAQDPLRTSLRRAQLVQDLGSMLNTRKHVARPGGSGDDRFWQRVDSLSVADLWNLFLMSDLLARPRTQMAMWVLSERDREDRSGAWGGLVFYRAGEAEATLYPIVEQPGMDDLTYVPALRGKRGTGEYDFLADQRDSLARFICHFETADNAGRAGPTAAELKDAKAGNYYGLVLTTLSPETFAAHYFNPQGTVVSLGIFPLRKSN